MKHIIDVYKQWQPNFASYEIKGFDLPTKKEQAIIEMAGEAGEVLQVMTKARRKGEEIPREQIVDELGDTLWGLVGVMNTFGISFQELCDFNMEKLERRFFMQGKPR